MSKVTDSQLAVIRRWATSDYGSRLVDVFIEVGVGGKSYRDFTLQEAGDVLAVMTANYGKVPLGDDATKYDDRASEERGEGESGDADSDSNSDGDGGEGEGEGEGNSESEGEGEGEGDSEGEGDNDNQKEEEDKMDNRWPEGSKNDIIAEALIESDMNTYTAYDKLKDSIGEKPLLFQGNTGHGDREPLPMGSDHDRTGDKTQKGRTRKAINDVKRAMLEEDWHSKEPRPKGEGKSDDPKSGDPKSNGDGGGSGGGDDMKILYEAEILLRQLNLAREICDKMNADGEPFDTVGLRPYVHAPRMLSAGFTRLSILDAMTMSWPKEVRKELNDGKTLADFDQRKYPKSKTAVPMPLNLVDERLEPLAKKTGGVSAYIPAMVSLAKIGVPILQIGEKGTGKTTNAEHLANALEKEFDRDMPFGFASMTSGTSPGEFKGRITLDGFLPSRFQAIYEDGGVFLFDELDAGDENLLTLLNSALANRYFVNQQGKVIHQHEHAVPVAAANTMGLGANSRYTGRNRLDAATLDRWSMGRIRVDFDPTLAEYLFWKQIRELSPDNVETTDNAETIQIGGE